MQKRPACEATRFNDTMRCKCGLQWDVSDTDVPACRPLENRLTVGAVGRRASDSIMLQALHVIADTSQEPNIIKRALEAIKKVSE